jgi:hypothetical protein
LSQGWVYVKNSVSRAISLRTVVLVLGLIACLHLALWAVKNPATTAASIEDRLASVSYSRFEDAPSAGRKVRGFTPLPPPRFYVADVYRHLKADLFATIAASELAVPVGSGWCGWSASAIKN